VRVNGDLDGRAFGTKVSRVKSLETMAAGSKRAGVNGTRSGPDPGRRENVVQWSLRYPLRKKGREAVTGPGL